MAIKERKTRQVMTRVQIIQASDLFRQHIVKLDGDLVTYAEGFSDETIANAIQASSKAVADLRVELYGRLKAVKSRDDNGRVSELSEQVKLIQSQLDEIRVKYHKMILSMSLTGFKELKHLGLVEFDHMGNPLPKKQEK